jgi:Ricin-type beta-trefoil lectin domain.
MFFLYFVAGKRYPYHNLAFSKDCQYGIGQCACWGLKSHKYIHVRAECHEIFYFTSNKEIVYEDLSKCVIPSCTQQGCTLELAPCDGSSQSQWDFNDGGMIKHISSNLCVRRSDPALLDDVTVELFSCASSDDVNIRSYESEGNHCKFILKIHP